MRSTVSSPYFRPTMPSPARHVCDLWAELRWQKNTAVAAHHENANRVGMGCRKPPTLHLAHQAIDSYAAAQG